jgi:hypothetical protein
MRERALLLDLKIIGRRSAAALVDDELVADLLAFSEIAEARALDGADMDENVVSAGVRLNEAEALLRIEPFNGASLHGVSFRDVKGRPRYCGVFQSNSGRKSGADVFGRKSKNVRPKPDAAYMGEPAEEWKRNFRKIYSLPRHSIMIVARPDKVFAPRPTCTKPPRS